mgnify:CR=1 FL=1
MNQKQGNKLDPSSSKYLLDEKDPNFKSSYQRAGFFSKLHFCYTREMLSKANLLKKQKKPFTHEHLPKFGKEERAEYFEEHYFKLYQEYKAKNPNKSPPLGYIIWKTHKTDALLAYFSELAFLFIKIFMGWLLQKLLDELADPNSSVGDAFKWAGPFFACIWLSMYTHHQFFFYAAVITIRARAGLISLIYSKVSKVSLYSLNKLSIGKLVNVVANEVNAFERNGIFFFFLFLAPLALIAGTALLWILLGPSCLIGIGWILLGYPLQNFLAHKTNKPRQEKNKLADERIKMTNELIESIRLLKMYAWEMNFMQNIFKLRDKEVRKQKKILWIEGAANGLSQTSQAVASFLIFLTYWGTGHDLNVGLVFPTFYLMGLFRNNCVNFVSKGLNFLSESKILLRRVNDIMEMSEIEKNNSEDPKNPENVIEMSDFYGYWTKEEKPASGKASQKSEKKDEGTELLSNELKPTLVDINLEIKKGTLNAIIGKIGAGKSSLLLSLTGEMPKTKGTLRFIKSIAYVEQEPIIFSGTLRENILFGKEYDETRYNEVVKGCSLESDLKQFPNGDLSEIGERGINLSGGQKARVALARAIYSNAEIYLLDDPLSAVDTKVAKDLYNNAIMGLLKDKTVLLVTHQVHFIKDCPNIIFMDQGRILGKGTYEEFKAAIPDFQKFFNSSKTKTSRKFSEEMSFEEKAGIDELVVKQEEKEVAEENEIDAQERENRGKLFSQEDPHAGNVTGKTYKEYIKACISFCSGLLLIFVFAGNEVANVGYGRLIGYWADGTISENTSVLVCGLVALAIMIFYMLKNLIFYSFIMDGSHRLHDKMLRTVIRNPTSFFDTNPVGRVLNRFSNDVGVLDYYLPSISFQVVEAFFYFLGILITVWVTSPLILIPTIAQMVLLYFHIKYCLEGITQTKRYDLVSRSPLYSLFSLTLSGLVVVRSFQQENNFKIKFRELLNRNTKACFGFWIANRILGFGIDYLSSLTAIATIVIIILIKSSDSSLSGLSITYIITLVEFLQFQIRNTVQANSLMASTARVISYCNLRPEAPLQLPSDENYKNWPQQGKIEMSNVYMKYRENTNHVIKGLSISVRPGEKIGCVGRTGAGKSSIIQLLFRIVEIDRELKDSFVKIDDVDIQTLGLHLLRNSISIIPQIPVVFSGSVRRNLDPLNQHTDEELWHALEEVKLKDYVSKLDHKLETDMTNVSSVFSVGQKQLICLARAILKKSKILVLDEATANVDFQTDNFIQHKIIEKFPESTIFTIAHRLSTIAHYDRVLVLDKGMKVEFDSPYKLLVKNIGDEEITNTQGYFASMVLNTGPKASKIIFNICKDKYMKSNE